MCEELSIDAMWEMAIAVFSFLTGMLTQACMDYYYLRRLERELMKEVQHDS